jgi:hypothetical protein
LTHACSTAADAPVNYSLYVPQRPELFPSPRWETHVLLVVCRAAVSMSRVAQWPSHRAPSVGTQHLCVLTLKIPIAGATIDALLEVRTIYVLTKCLVDMSISILIFYDGCYLELPVPVWSTCHLHLKLQKFPSLRWENALLTCPFRFSSFMMGAASNYQYGVCAICA